MRSDRVLEGAEDLPRLAVARALREHPEWSLGDVFDVIARGGPRAEVLGELTIAELLVVQGNEVGSTVDRSRRWRAMRAGGDEFDQLVLEVLREAPGAVGASYLRARLGGPRWKLLKSLGRLIDEDEVAKSGNTSATLYRAVRQSA